MARALPTLVVIALLGATATAFVLTENSKLERSPIARTQVDKLFSPLCECPKDRASIRFFLRKPDRLTVTIVRGGRTVDTLVDGRAYGKGWVDLSWDGIQPTGIAVADGGYEPRVHLAREHRTITLPNTIRVDTTAPKLVGVQISPPSRKISPDGDGRGDELTVRYRASERAHGVLYVDRKQRVYGKFARVEDAVHFFGKVHGKPLRTGHHVLTFAVEDRAGNRTTPVRIGTLTIRYVTLGRPLVSIGPGQRFYILASADAKWLRWRLAGRTGRAHPGTLVFRAPKKPGTYRLYVIAGAHAASAKVKVERVR